jgi:SAM-dependent methyltransferase
MPPVELDPEYFPSDPTFVVLDVGSGAGGIAETYARERHVIAVEHEQDLALEVAERRLPTLSVCRGDAHELPMADDSVDGVTALEVLEHVEDPDRALTEIHRVLKPGGALCVAVPTSYTERIYKNLHPRYMSNATHVRVFRKSALLRRLERLGFATPRVSVEHFEPALCWMVYALLRAESDPTGRVLEHHSVEPKVARTVARISATKGIGRALRFTQRHFGKSWYVYSRKSSSSA